jgi:DNA-binding PadR family transcriptional regulator
MRSLKYAILGLIIRNPISGYDIMKEFNEELVNFWSAKHSQIYPELKKLVDEGLVEYTVIITGTVLEKKLYTITEQGKSDFLSWLVQIEPLEPTPKEVFRLRMYYANHIEREHLKEMIQDQLDQRLQKLNYLKEAMDEYQEVPDITDTTFGDYIVLDGAILREESSIKWLKNCLKHLGR